MKRRDYHIGPGAASLLLVAVVVSMSVLGLLALINARNDYRLTDRSVRFAEAEYAVSAAAERRLAGLDALLVRCAAETEDEEAYFAAVAEGLEDDMYMEDGLVCWTQSAEEGRMLMCAVEIYAPDAPRRLAWREHMFVAAETEEMFE